MNLENLENCGWKSEEIAAYVSLKSAIQSYFDTYRALSFVKSVVDFSTIRTLSQSGISEYEISEYKNDYFTSITHFQHFFELILKDSLERIDPLLAKKMDEKGIVDIYCKLNGTTNPDSEKIQSIEFSDALKRLQKIREINPNDTIIKEIRFLLDNYKTLEKSSTNLNTDYKVKQMNSITDFIGVNSNDNYIPSRENISNSLLPKLDLKLTKIKKKIHSLNKEKISKLTNDKLLQNNKIKNSSRKEDGKDLIKEYYNDIKKKGYLSFIPNKGANTIFMRKFHKKYQDALKSKKV